MKKTVFLFAVLLTSIFSYAQRGSSEREGRGTSTSTNTGSQTSTSVDRKPAGGVWDIVKGIVLPNTTIASDEEEQMELQRLKLENEKKEAKERQKKESQIKETPQKETVQTRNTDIDRGRRNQ